MTRAGCARPCAALAACNAAAAPLRAMRLSRASLAAALRLRASTTAAAARVPPPLPPPPPPPRGAGQGSRRKLQTLVPSSTALAALQPALGTAEVLWARERAPKDRPAEPEARACACVVSALNVRRRHADQAVARCARAEGASGRRARRAAGGGGHGLPEPRRP
jgi:hypothetical protein